MALFVSPVGVRTVFERMPAVSEAVRPASQSFDERSIARHASETRFCRPTSVDVSAVFAMPPRRL